MVIQVFICSYRYVGSAWARIYFVCVCVFWGGLGSVRETLVYNR